MGRRIHRLCAFLLAGGLVLWAPVDARGDPEHDPFEVIVLRGAQVLRVTGTPSGPIREEVLREAARPAEPVPEPEPAAREPDAEPPPPVVVYVVPERTFGYPVVVGDRRFPDHDFRRDGRKPYPRSWTTAHSSRRIDHMGSRDGHAGRHDAHRR